MVEPHAPHPVRALRMLARRAAAGETVTPRELSDVLGPLEPFTHDFVHLRALHAIALEPDLEGYAVRRRLYHAARALANRFDLEQIDTFPLAVPPKRS
jgi:hypothetical protein